MFSQRGRMPEGSKASLQIVKEEDVRPSTSSLSADGFGLKRKGRSVRGALGERNAVGVRSKSTVCYREDSEDGDDHKKRKGRYSEDDDYIAHENGEPVGRKLSKRCSRQSAREAAEKLKGNFASSSDEN